MSNDDVTAIDIGDGTELNLSPKGWFVAMLEGHGVDREAADAEWRNFEHFCVRHLMDPDVEYVALVFDGVGGTVVSAEPE